MTVASDPEEKAELRLMTESSGQAIVVLADTPYYESLENAMKIRKYVKQRNVAQLPKSVETSLRITRVKLINMSSPHRRIWQTP